MTVTAINPSWPYKRHEDLLDAGFRCRGTVKCPLCDNAVGIYQKPNEMPVFVNVETYRPHLEWIHTGSDGNGEPIDNKTAAAGSDR